MPVGFSAILVITCWIGLLMSLPSRALGGPVSASLIAESDAVVPGQPLRLGVRLQIEPRWHIYWLNAGDQGEPTRVAWSLPDGFSASPLRFPTPSVYTLPGPIVSFGYGDEVLLVTTVDVPEQIDQPQVKFVADVSWMACDVTCTLGESRIELTLPVRQQGAPANEAIFAKHDATVPRAAIEVDPDATVSLEPTGEGRFAMTARVRLPEDAHDVEFFPPAVEGGAWSDLTVQIQAGHVAVVRGTLRSFSATPARVTAETVIAWRERDGGRASVMFPAERLESSIGPRQ